MTTNRTASPSITWALKTLNAQHTKVDLIIDPPWSTVHAIYTPKGLMYLKQTPPLIGLEATITRYLKDTFDAPVPHVIAHNHDLQCFLMEDAGTPLRAYLKESFEIDILCKALDSFASLQMQTSDHVNELMKIGVPDWRLEKIPTLFENLLADTPLLTQDGLSRSEIDALKETPAFLDTQCEEIAAYAIPPTLVQCDFHDNNILLDKETQQLTFIDLGEVVISHPFFSLLGCLYQLVKHHGLHSNDESYQMIKRAYLKHIASNCDIDDLLKRLMPIHLVYGALAQYRLMLACGKEKLLEYQPKRLGNHMRLILDYIKP